MIIATKYDYGQTVYLTTDEQQKRHIVTEIKLCQKPVIDENGFTECVYGLSSGSVFQYHNEVEITSEINLAIKLDMQQK